MLRLRLWRTWEGLLAGFRRVEGLVLRKNLVGIAVGVDQGGNAQLFLIHQSGHHLYAGFSGERRRLDEVGAEIQCWLHRGATTGLSPEQAS